MSLGSGSENVCDWLHSLPARGAHARTESRQYVVKLAAGLALQEAGVITPATDVRAAVDSLIDRRFATASR